MRPTLGRVVLYSDAHAGELAAMIIRVEWGLPAPPADDSVPHGPTFRHGELPSLVEGNYRVWLAIFDPGIAQTRYPAPPIAFDDAAIGAINTWRWPPRV